MQIGPYVVILAQRVDIGEPEGSAGAVLNLKVIAYLLSFEPVIVVYFLDLNQTDPVVHAASDNSLQFGAVADVGDEGTVACQSAIFFGVQLVQNEVIIVDHDGDELLILVLESCDLPDGRFSHDLAVEG